MRAFVFTDHSLSEQAGRFVWLAINTEKAENAPLRRKFPVQALPTFLIVDPVNEGVALRWVGGATLPQLRKLLDDGRLAVARHGSSPTDRARSPDRILIRADRLYGAADYAAAVKAYQEVLAAAPAGWPRYGRTVESLLFALSQTKDDEQTAKLARDAYPRLRRTSSAANVAASGLDAALQLPAEHPSRRELVTALEADAREVIANRTVPMAADDRSAVYASVIDARDDVQDSLGARKVAVERAVFLEREAARAKTPEQRAVYDSHRLATYLKLGEPERAIPMLQASERDLPEDYNPPARLATAYKAMRHWDEALAASDRALTKAYGPRKLGMLQTRAEIFTGRGDTAAARRTLEEAVSMAESLPAEQRSETTIASLKKKLEALPQ